MRFGFISSFGWYPEGSWAGRQGQPGVPRCPALIFGIREIHCADRVARGAGSIQVPDTWSKYEYLGGQIYRGSCKNSWIKKTFALVGLPY